MSIKPGEDQFIVCLLLNKLRLPILPSKIKAQNSSSESHGYFLGLVIAAEHLLAGALGGDADGSK